VPITVEAIYENGVLKPVQPLPLKEHERVPIIVQTSISRARQTAGLLRWTGSLEDPDYLINDVENDPLEGP
jgi:predicted DNA-binding antitoxin AbrB/MazE fold protein